MQDLLFSPPNSYTVATVVSVLLSHLFTLISAAKMATAGKVSKGTHIYVTFELVFLSPCCLCHMICLTQLSFYTHMNMISRQIRSIKSEATDLLSGFLANPPFIYTAIIELVLYK